MPQQNHPVATKKVAGVKTSMGIMLDLTKMDSRQKADALAELRMGQFSGKKFLTPNEFGDSVNVKGDKIRQLCKKGKIEATKDAAGRWIIPYSQLGQFSQIKMEKGGATSDRAKLEVHIPWKNMPGFMAYMKSTGQAPGQFLRYYNKPGLTSTRPELDTY